MPATKGCGPLSAGAAAPELVALPQLAWQPCLLPPPEQVLQAELARLTVGQAPRVAQMRLLALAISGARMRAGQPIDPAHCARIAMAMFTAALAARGTAPAAPGRPGRVRRRVLHQPA